MCELTNLQHVDTGIYRSGIVTEKNFHVVKELEIKSIISMKTRDSDNEVEKRLAHESNIIYINHPINIAYTAPETLMQFYAVEHLMDLLPKPILIHCTRGSDRTGIAIAMFRILHWKFSAKEAIAEMQRYGFNPIFRLWLEFIEAFAEVNKP